MALIDNKAQRIFSDVIVDKGLVIKFKEKLNLPTYLLERLILKYQSKEFDLQEVERVNSLLQERIVKAKNNLKVQAKIRDKGNRTIIDKVMAKSSSSGNQYWAHLLNLGTKKIQISEEIIRNYPQLLENGLWSEVKINHLAKEATKEREFEIKEVNPLSKNNFELEDFKQRRNEFTTFQWLCFLLRSMGLEALNLPKRNKLLLISRLIPFVEKNYNYIELGSRGTGKSYTYRQLSNEGILVSGGKTTVANLFYNMGTKEIGLVGKWDVVAFDEVAYISFKDKTAVQILKDYMESGSFSRGKEEINAEASMVFLGNINKDISVLLNKNHLFEPLPELMQDIALIDRFHFYLPGWEMNKLKESSFTTHYGLQNSYLALALNKLRELDFTDIIDDYFIFDEKMDVRDKRAVKKTVSGYLKLLHPNGKFTKQELKLYLDIALEGRKRVKEQLIKIAPFEYQETTFKYFDREDGERYHPNLPEDSMDLGFKSKLPPPGTVYIGQIINDKSFSLLKLEISAKPGKGKLIFTGHVDHTLKKQIRKTFLFVKNKKLNLELKNKIEQNDFYVKLTTLMNRIEVDISNAFFIAIYSLLNNKSVSSGLLVTEQSSLYRKSNSNYVIKALKVEKENGEVRTLLPLNKKNIFVEVPSEVIAYAPYFITV